MNSVDCYSRIEGGMHAALESLDADVELEEVLSYALFPCGKLIRPRLVAAIGEVISGPRWDTILPATVSLELLHCASLVHDDLPALDDDQMRRGRASCHAKFGEARALLAGDFLASFAIQWAAKSQLSDAAQMVEICTVLSGAYSRVMQGQLLDLDSTLKRKDLLGIYKLKTGALFEAAFLLGVLQHKCYVELKEKALLCGQAFGVLYQLIDDFLDVNAPSSLTGREVRSDQKNERYNPFCSSDGISAGSLMQEAKKNFLMLYGELKNALRISRVGGTTFEPLDRMIETVLSKDKFSK